MKLPALDKAGWLRQQRPSRNAAKRPPSGADGTVVQEDRITARGHRPRLQKIYCFSKTRTFITRCPGGLNSEVSVMIFPSLDTVRVLRPTTSSPCFWTISTV